MTLLYGAGVRASWGVLDESAKQGFWWVKVPDEHSSAKSQPEEDERKVVAASKQWPEPFALLYTATPEQQRYVHVVADRLHSDRWCSSRCALVGDAAHPVTPNMAQGANLAMEDAFVLAVLLSRATQVRLSAYACLVQFGKSPRTQANEKDARLEAFYQYCRRRQPHVARVAAESYQQSKIGQWRHPLLVKLREAILRLVPASVLQKKLKKVNVWPIATWVAEFQDRVASGSHAPPLGQQPELRT
jgi:2-polyprenyl-6-methoxyphenol hydroxylase-like FAD-dependent oxidoreductase